MLGVCFDHMIMYLNQPKHCNFDCKLLEAVLGPYSLSIHLLQWPLKNIHAYSFYKTQHIKYRAAVSLLKISDTV